MDYQVVLSLSARADLRDIVRYISFDAPDRALQFGWFLISRTRLLARSPELGRIVPEFGEEFIREIIVSSYRVVYRLNHPQQLVEVSQRDPKTFRFTVLERVSPDMPAADVIQLENSWKRRLHTYARYGGLNDN